MLVPLSLHPSDDSEKIIVVNSQETFGQCMKEAGIGAFTVPSLGITREQAEKHVQSYDFQGFAKNWISLLDDGYKNDAVAKLVISGPLVNNKLANYNRDGLMVGLLLCGLAYSKYKGGQNSEVPLALIEGTGETAYKKTN